MTRALLVLLALGIAAAVLAADAPVKVYVDGKLQTYSPPAILRGGSVYVPLRAGAKSLGIDVKWIAASQTAQICTDEGCTLIPKSDGVIVNGSARLVSMIAAVTRTLQTGYVYHYAFTMIIGVFVLMTLWLNRA